MEKTLIVYYSNSGTAERLALHAKRLLPAADIDRIGYAGRNFKRHSFISAIFKVPGAPDIEGDVHNPKDYQQVTLVFPVWAGKPAPVMKEYVKKYAESMPDYNAVCVSGGEGSKSVEWLTEKIGRAPKEKLEVTSKTVDSDGYNLTGII